MIDSVPLIQNPNDAQQINASIIALKKASRELDEKIAQFNKLLSLEITNREKAITEAINSLDVPSVGGSGKYISAISETDGKISATASDITSTVSSGNSQPVTSGGVAEAIIGNTIYNPCYNDYDTTFNIDTVGAGHRTYVASSVGGGTSGNCPSHYGVVHTITANGTAWKFQVAKETYSDTTYTRQNINDGGWTDWQKNTNSKDLGTLRSDGSSIEKRIYIANSYSIGTVYYHHTGQDSYAFNYRVVAGVVTSIGWLSTSDTDPNIAVSYNSTDGYMSVFSRSNVIAQVVVTGTALIKIE